MTAIPWHVAPQTHLFFALTLFYGGGVYIALQCVIDSVVGHIEGAARVAGPPCTPPTTIRFVRRTSAHGLTLSSFYPTWSSTKQGCLIGFARCESGVSCLGRH